MNDTGSTTIEMIAWLPILLLVIAGIFQFGLYFNARNAVQAAAFEAARQAAVSRTPELTAKQVTTAYAGGTLPGWVEGQRLRTSISIVERGRPNESIEVLVTYDTPIYMAGILGIGGEAENLKVKGTSHMQLEELP